MQHHRQILRQRSGVRSACATASSATLCGRVWPSSAATRTFTPRLLTTAPGKTLVAASSRDEALRQDLRYGGNKPAAVAVGKAIAQRALEAGLKEVVFDRRDYKYHGRVAALAEAAREAGLKF